MRDKVSSIFAKAPYFIFLEVVDNQQGGITIQKNEASRLSQGTGPIVMKNLKDRGVKVVIACEIGPGAKTLMEISGIRLWKIEAGTKVSKAIQGYIDSQA
jgi:predicted Fe-Mo cluster-binding NifX family protein